MNLDFTRPFFIGIGGSGMSALAHILLDLGLEIYGSDKSEFSSIVNLLKERGVKFYNSPNDLDVVPCDMIIYSTAIDRKNNENYLRLSKRGIPSLHRSQLLHKIFSFKKSIAVAGSHGKTSTTAMISQILMESGMDPAIMIGGEVSFLERRGGRWGNGIWGVYESDESDGTFLNHKPDVKIVTNIDNDHLDHYKTYNALVSSFGKFVENKSDTTSIVYSDDPGVGDCLAKLESLKGIITYSENLKISDKEKVGFLISEEKLIFSFQKHDYTLKLPFPGDHYLKNALASIIASEIAGVNVEKSIKILENYKGVKRRLEFLGEKNGIKIYDDYGHHPTEIQSVISSIKLLKKDSGRCVVLFQPHRFTRTKELYNQFAEALTGCDLVFLLPIYSAGEKTIENISSKLILENFSDPRKIILLSGNIRDDVSHIQSTIHVGDILVTLGAGNVREWGELLLSE